MSNRRKSKAGQKRHNTRRVGQEQQDNKKRKIYRDIKRESEERESDGNVTNSIMHQKSPCNKSNAHEIASSIAALRLRLHATCSFSITNFSSDKCAYV